MKTKHGVPRIGWITLALLSSVLIGQAFYNPQTGRWLNRDPIGEDGGAHLHAYVDNDPASNFDVLGRKTETMTVLEAKWTFKPKTISSPSKKKRGTTTGSTYFGAYPLDIYVTEKGCEAAKKQLLSKRTRYVLEYWYTDAASKVYEEGNVRVVQDNWRTFGQNVNALGGCVCAACASCRQELAVLYQQVYSMWTLGDLLEREVVIQNIESLEPAYAAAFQKREQLRRDAESKKTECEKICP